MFTQKVKKEMDETMEMKLREYLNAISARKLREIANDKGKDVSHISDEDLLESHVRAIKLFAKEFADVQHEDGREDYYLDHVTITLKPKSILN